jgi:fatty-acyl-CoA synthase
VTAPPAGRTLGALLDEVAVTRPQAEAVVFRDCRLSYAALRAQVDEFARALLTVGIRRGDRVAVLLPNRPEWLVAALATAKVGGIVTALSTFSTPREIHWALEHSQASALVTVETFRGHRYLSALHDLCPELSRSEPGQLRSTRLPRLQTVLCVEGGQHDGTFALREFLAGATRTPSAQLGAVQRSIAHDDICLILYTSGSTATPKGVMLAHGDVIANGFHIGERQHLTAADRLWLAVPLFWSFGSANALAAIMTHGGSIVLQERFEPGEALELLDREQCSVYYGMANMARAILEHPERHGRRLAAMRTGLTIGLPEDLAMTMEAVGARELCNVYGSTETYGNCAVTDAHDSLPLRLHTQGLPLPGMEIRVVHAETGRPLATGEVGELAVRGRVTPGYYRAPELTREAFDRDGYFLTGDVGLIDDDGRVRYRGRLKEIIKTGGVNVAPLEVEGILLQHPDVKQAYVVGLADREKDEIVAAAIELRAGATVGADGIVAFCRERLASYKVPTRLAFCKAEEFPRTPTGKIHKPGLREHLEAGREARRPEED